VTGEDEVVNEDALRAELAKIRDQQRALATRAGEIMRLLSFPYVDPVLVFYRRGVEYEEELNAYIWEEETPLEQALNRLRSWEEDDYCSPTGVTVGGEFISYEELQRRFAWTARV
jgi:hypothetical protein